MSNIEREYKAVVSALGVSLLLFLALFHVFYGGIVSAFGILMGRFASFDTVYIVSELVLDIAYLFIFLLPVMFFYGISKNVKNHPMDLTLRMPERKPLFSYVAIIFSGLAVVIVMSYVNRIIIPIPPTVSLDLFQNIKSTKAYVYALSFFGSAVVPAFAEELLFRGLIISNLKPYSRIGAVAVSAVAFGLMHQNPIQIIYATAAGVVLAMVYLKTESIWCCIALHFVNNFVSIAQSIAVSLFGRDSVILILMCIDFAIVAAGIVFGLLLLFQSLKYRKSTSLFRRFELSKHSEEELTTSKFCIGTIFNPALLVFVLLCIGVTVVKGFEIYGI